MEDQFDSHYECRVLEELPSNSSALRYFYQPLTSLTGQDGISVLILPTGGVPWIGTFAFGKMSTSKEVSGLYTTPNPDRFCVIAKGEGYIVSVHDPNDWELVSATPVLGVHILNAVGLVVFSDYTHLVSYNHNGLFWKTESLASDGFDVNDITATDVYGRYWDAPSASDRSFKVSLATGKLKY
jgi:hypothetical protein